jgi:hypothetical protein
MAPKKCAKPPKHQQHQPQTPWQQSVAALSQGLGDARPSDVNAAHYAALQGAIDTIMAHPTFDGITSSAPLTI